MGHSAAGCRISVIVVDWMKGRKRRFEVMGLEEEK